MHQYTFLCACGCGQFVGYDNHRHRINRYIWRHQMSPRVHLGDRERFWSYVDRSGDCWLWVGGHNRDGYGSFTVHDRTILAHRHAWEMTRGPIPPGMQVNHHCPDGDTPACVNPAHLWLGTQDENIADAVQKGRRPRGEAHRDARLTADQVREMRALRAATGLSYRAIGDRYGVAPGTVWFLVKRLNWRHVE